MNVSGHRRPRVALATAADWPALAPDDAGLAPALDRAGVDAEIAVWTDGEVDWGRFDLILVRSCWNYHDDLPRWFGWVAGLEGRGWGGRLCNPPAVLRWNAHKTYLADLAARGVPVIPTMWMGAAALSSWPAFQAALASVPWDDVVCKPAISAGARATFRGPRAALASADSVLRAAWPDLIQRAPVLVQPFVPQIVTHGEWSLLFFDDGLSHAVVKRPAAGDFRVQEKHRGTTCAAVPPPRLLAVASQTLTAAAASIGGADGDAAPLVYARVDLVETPTGPLLVELELIEPALFLSTADEPPGAAAPARGMTKTEAAVQPADRLAAAIAGRVRRR